jgi:transcription termination/antitermination protein NusG
MQKWYVVHVLSTHEKKVKKALEDQSDAKIKDMIEKVILPIENVSEVKKGQQKVVEKRLWPGYLLVKMILTDDTWHHIKNIPGVIDFLGGGTPTSLTDSEVQDIMSDLEQKKSSVTHKHKFQVGDHVKIVEGVFVNFMGTVTEVFHDKGRLSLLVSIFGRETRVDDLEFSQVEEVLEGLEE